MPEFKFSYAVTTRDVSVVRALCNGCDPVRPCDEHVRLASMWVLTAGAIELRNAAGRHVVDPTQAIVMPRGHEFRVRHTSGPDTCLSFRGPLIDALAADGARIVAISPAHLARIAAGVASHDELAIAETIAELHPSAEPAGVSSARRTTATAPDRKLSAAVAHTLRANYAEPTSLDELARTTGYSVFHTCRVFRATTGFTINGFRRELRLRNALSRILDSRAALSEIALATGFASQSHLTNLFRARFGITPAKARTPAGHSVLARAA